MPGIDITNESARLGILALSEPIAKPAKTLPNAGINEALAGAALDAGEASESGVPPVVGNVLPAPGSTLRVNEPIVLDVTDDVGLLRVLLLAAYNFLDAPELVHDGTIFTSAYSINSRRDAIPLGWRYTLLRKSGWPADPTFTVYAMDQTGNEA